MSIRYIEPFVDACIHVFRDFLRTTAEARTPYLVNRGDAANWEVSGIIGLSGDAKGVVVLSFPSGLASMLTETLAGESGKTDADDVADAVGEIVNIVAGNAKRGLEQYRLTISLPSIVRGPNHHVVWPSGIQIVGIPFSVPSGHFLLSVGLDRFSAD